MAKELDIKVEDKDGKVIQSNKKSLRPIDGSKIGNKTAQKLRDAENLDDIKIWLGRIFDIDNPTGSS